MPRLPTWAALVCAAALPLACGDVVSYHLPPPRLSPHENLNVHFAGNYVFLSYGRPYTTDPNTGIVRTVWGGDLVPFGKVWRTGADEATTLTTQKAITLGSGADALHLAPGAYTLFTYPASTDDVSLIVSRDIGEWGLQYNPRLDIGRVPLQRNTLKPALHQFTMALERVDSHTGVIKLLWENVQYSVTFTVGDTHP